MDINVCYCGKSHAWQMHNALSILTKLMTPRQNMFQTAEVSEQGKTYNVIPHHSNIHILNFTFTHDAQLVTLLYDKRRRQSFQLFL